MPNQPITDASHRRRPPFSAYFIYIHPNDADALAMTCEYNRQMVDDEYERVGRDAVLPGGIWHHHLCKRAQRSVATTHSNHMPKALASLVDGRCIVCRRRHPARASVWGFAAHAPCVRGMLIDTFAIPKKLGLSCQDVSAIPSERLSGHRGRRGRDVRI